MKKKLLSCFLLASVVFGSMGFVYADTGGGDTNDEQGRDLIFNIDGCKYGSKITVNGDGATIATIDVLGEESTVEYNGSKSTINGDVVLSDVKAENISFSTDNTVLPLGSDVVSVDVQSQDGKSLFSKNDYSYPSSEITVDFGLSDSATVNIGYDNLSFLTDQVLDWSLANPEEANADIPVLKDSLKSEYKSEDGTMDFQPGSAFYSTNNSKISGQAQLMVGHVIIYPSGAYTTNEFTVNLNGRNNLAYCANASKRTPKNGVYGYTEFNRAIGGVSAELAEEIIKLVSMYTQGEDFAYEGDQVFGTTIGDRDRRITYVHSCISMMYEGTVIGLTRDEIQAIRNAVNFVRDVNVPRHRDQLRGYELYVMNCGSGFQDIMTTTRSPKGKVQLNKVSGNSQITQNNGNYTLQGAVYGVYRDQACQQEVGRITTNAQGTGELGNLDIGQYFIKEISPSQGYELDRNVYPVNAE